MSAEAFRLLDRAKQTLRKLGCRFNNIGKGGNPASPWHAPAPAKWTDAELRDAAIKGDADLADGKFPIGSACHTGVDLTLCCTMLYQPLWIAQEWPRATSRTA